MKKLGIIVLSALLLAGCSSSGYSVKVTDNTSNLLTIAGIQINKQGYFEHLLDNYGASKIVSDALEKIADIEVTDQKEIDALVKDRKDVYSAYADTSLNEFAVSLGYANEEEFVNEALVPDAKQELLRNKYIEENFDALITEYQVARIKKITVEKESEALDIIAKATDEDAFNALMDDENYKDNAEDYDIVNKNTALDDNLVAKLEEFSKLEKDGVYSNAIELTDGDFAVIYIYDTTREDKQEYVETLTIESELQLKIEGYYLKKYNFNVYDEKLKAAVKNISSGYIE